MRRLWIPTFALLLTLVGVGSPLAAGGNIRVGFAQVDPGLSADLTIDNITLSADLDSGPGPAIGLELEGRRVSVGLDVTRTDHDLGVIASGAGQTIDFGTITEAEIYTAVVSLRYRFNPDSRAVFSLAALGGGIGYLDFELPDGDTADGGTTAFGLEGAVDLHLARASGWFIRLAYRQMEADIDFDDLDEQLGDSPFEPSAMVAQIGYRFGRRR